VFFSEHSVESKVNVKHSKIALFSVLSHEPENVYKFLVLICGHFYSV